MSADALALAAALAESLAALPWPAVAAWLAIVATAAGHEYAPAATPTE